MIKEGLHFPYYSLRTYHRLWNDGVYKLIDTFWGTFIIDYVNKARGDTLAERRLHLRMIEATLPYKLYNLENRCTNVAQMMLAKQRVFIDRYGNLKKVRKPHRFKLLCCQVVNITEIGFKKYGISFLLNNTIEYFVHNEPSNYVQVLLLKTGWLYYASTAEKLPDTVRGL